MLAIGILALGIFSRVVIHIPGFTPVIALALFSGVYLKRSYAVIVPVLLMMVSDLFLGWHDTILYTWGSMALISGLGIWLKNHKTPRSIITLSAASSIIFFLITNFGAWLSLYPHTPEGLMTSYIAALPFFRNELLSTLIYGALLFWAYELITRRVKGTALAGILM